MTRNEWCVVKVIQGSFEEDQICAFLRAHEIPVQSRGETLRHTHAMVMDGLGRVEILVPGENAAEARDLLQKVDRGEFRLGDSQAPEV